MWKGLPLLLWSSESCKELQACRRPPPPIILGRELARALTWLRGAKSPLCPIWHSMCCRQNSWRKPNNFTQCCSRQRRSWHANTRGVHSLLNTPHSTLLFSFHVLIVHPHTYRCGPPVNGFYQHWLHPVALTGQNKAKNGPIVLGG